MKLGRKKDTVDSILSTFTTGIAKLKALADTDRNTATALRMDALALSEKAAQHDAEANRAVTVVENMERLLAVPVPVENAQNTA